MTAIGFIIAVDRADFTLGAGRFLSADKKTTVAAWRKAALYADEAQALAALAEYRAFWAPCLREYHHLVPIVQGSPHRRHRGQYQQVQP